MEGASVPKTPRLSIITVVRNASAALAETIESVRAQTYSPLEFVVVDGASTDGTVDVMRSNGNVIAKWISEPDEGLYDAMNKGKALVTGDFAMFVNAGDRFVNSVAISQMMTHVTEPDTLYFGKVRLVDCTGRLSWEVPSVARRSLRPPQSYLPHHQSIFYPSRVYRGLDYKPQMGYRADAEYTTRALQASRREFTNVLLIESRLGGLSSREIKTLDELRREIGLETALARHISAETGRRRELIEVG